jgi:hypothetical protein
VLCGCCLDLDFRVRLFFRADRRPGLPLDKERLTQVTPEKTVAASMSVGAEQVSSLAYERWCDQDQQMLSGLLSSMTEDVLRDIIAAKSSREVWDSLEMKFTSSTKARTVQIRVELATVKKRDMFAADFFRKITSLIVELVATDAPLRDEEVLAGLLTDYDPFVTSMTIKAKALSLDDVFAHLVAFEARKLQHLADL